MKRLLLYIVLIATVLIPGASCNRKILPVDVSGKKYDEAAFNFVFVEALKQKLLGNGGDALKYLEQCVKINPESDAAYYQMAQIVVAGGDLTNGKKYALKAINIDDKNLWYLMMMAGMYYQEKKIDSAIIYYEKAVKTFPDNDKLQLTLGNLYSENNNFDKAISIFDSFDEKYGVNDASTISAIRNLMSSGRFEEALVKARKMLEQKPDELLYNGLLAEIYRGKGDKKEALDVYNSLIERNPDNAATQLSLCDFLITEKSYDELFVFLSTVILNINVVKEDKISLLARIVELTDLNNDQQDKLMLSLMILEANYKDDDIIPLLRPELLISQERLNEAATRLEEIIKVRKENYYAWEKLLLVYLQLNDYEKLTRRGEECASLFNMSFLAKILYATGAIETKKYEIALEELRKAEILAGDNNEYLLQVLTLRADLYYKMKDYTKSFAVFDQAIGMNSEDLTILNNYAYYLAEQNLKLKEAEEMARRVIEKESTNNTFLDTYAWVLYKRGKLKEAARIMETIIGSGDKPSAEWYEHYGYILKKQDKCKDAVLNWNIAIKLDAGKNDLNNEIANCIK
ncbi:MAG: tetratricopeptide repeat protein [Bacteroidales bacterium]|nr:tetratricopeptide repeat protein [Bacteroidales bacterium]